MVLVFDDNDETGHLIRSDLHRRLIPCAVGKDEKLFPYALVYVSYMDSCDDLSYFDSETILLADRAALSDSARRDSELCRLASRIEDIFFVKYGFDPYNVTAGGISDFPDDSRYVGRTCYFTAVQKLIIRALALMKEPYADSEILNRYCLKADSTSGAVAVHINKINLRAYMCSPIKPISSKKYKGYYLTRK